MVKTYLKVHTDLFEHEKTLLVAEMLKTKTLYVGAHLVSLWTWAICNRVDGKLEGMTPGQIALAAKWEGDSGKFLSALQTAKYIDSDLSLHNWNKYAGKLIQWRTANKNRMQLDRTFRKLGGKVSRNSVRSSNASMEEKKRAWLEDYYRIHPNERPKK
jgi:hypothetical protein